MPHATSKDGVKIHYLVEGSGDEAVLLLHGLGDSAPQWRPQIDALTGDRRVVAVSVRGHGESDKPPGPYSMGQMADDAAACLDDLGIDRVHVVGISMGTGVAFELAIRDPGRVTSLVIINGHPTIRAGGLKAKVAVAIRKAMARFMTPAQIAPKIAQRLFPDPGQEALRDDVTRRLAANDPDSYRESLLALARFHRAEEAARLPMPTLYIHSELDYTPLEIRQPFVDAMPDARLAVVSGARHAVTLERPDEVNELITDFLAEVAHGPTN